MQHHRHELCLSDDGSVSGLDDTQISRINQLVSNTANENVKPPIYPLTDIMTIQGKRIIAVSVRKGISRPYQTSKGVYLVNAMVHRDYCIQSSVSEFSLSAGVTLQRLW